MKGNRTLVHGVNTKETRLPPLWQPSGGVGIKVAKGLESLIIVVLEREGTTGDSGGGGNGWKDIDTGACGTLGLQVFLLSQRTSSRLVGRIL